MEISSLLQLYQKKDIQPDSILLLLTMLKIMNWNSHTYDFYLPLKPTQSCVN